VALDTTALVTGAVGGAAVQSVLGPLISQRHERRDLRAAVIRGISEVEIGRWASSERPYQEFLTALAAVRAAALVASIPRELADRYVRFAFVARRTSDISWEEYAQDPETGGGIPVALSALVTTAADLLMEYAWHPYRRRLRLKADATTLDRLKDATKRNRKEVQEWLWDWPLF
jgi:hypothetical protein